MKPDLYPQEPKNVWDIFYQFTQTPRPSKKEDKIRDYVKSIAQEQKLDFFIDEVGNISIFKPGQGELSSSGALLIQNHLDMVTDVQLGKTFNFLTDPLELKVQGNYLSANGTTLGADNGIGCAAALALIYEKEISHPPLELLFTIDEETGLNGALNIDTSKFTAKRMLNLDTEEWGSFYIGCAGGIDCDLQKSFQLSSKTLANTYRIELSGLSGGHSGLEIHEQRANAIKELANVLSKIDSVEIVEFRGGKAHNIIPHTAFCIFNTDMGFDEIKLIIDQTRQSLLSFLPLCDHDLLFSLEPYEVSTNKNLSEIDSKSFIHTLELFPHGAHRYDRSMKEQTVSASNNLARCLLVGEKAYFMSSLRFFDREEIRTQQRQLVSISEKFGYKLQFNSEYPSWKPAKTSVLLDKSIALYEKKYGKRPQVKAIHAGLECGILKDRMGQMDVISFGPNIFGAHTSEERVDIKSVRQFWDFLLEIIQNI